MLVRNQWIGIVALFLVVAGGGAFAAFDPIGNDGDVDACFEKKSGDLDLLKGKKCGKGETTVSWSQDGPQGVQGPPGETGPAGANGQQGPAGRSALSELQSGETIRGAWGLHGDGDSSSEQVTGVTLPIPAPQPVDSLHVAIAENDTVTGSGCDGTASDPVAGPGFVCIYNANPVNTFTGGGHGARSNLSSDGATGDGSRFGFVIRITGNTNFESNGTWAYTAP